MFEWMAWTLPVTVFFQHWRDAGGYDGVGDPLSHRAA
jgi:hypothetical protein